MLVSPVPPLLLALPPQGPKLCQGLVHPLQQPGRATTLEVACHHRLLGTRDDRPVPVLLHALAKTGVVASVLVLPDQENLGARRQPQRNRQVVRSRRTLLLALLRSNARLGATQQSRDVLCVLDTALVSAGTR